MFLAIIEVLKTSLATIETKLIWTEVDTLQVFSKLEEKQIWNQPSVSHVKDRQNFGRSRNRWHEAYLEGEDQSASVVLYMRKRTAYVTTQPSFLTVDRIL